MARLAPVLAAALLLTVPLQGCISVDDVPGFGGSDDGDGADGGNDGGDDGTNPGDGTDDPGPLPPLPPAEFNGTKAYQHVEEQVRWDNGTTRYRIPDTEGSRAVRRWLADELDALGLKVNLQQWKGTYVCEETRLVNVVGTLHGRSGDTILVGAHYDTRPWADETGHPADAEKPVVGANDGGSGVAVLLELARVLREHRPMNHTIKFVFFDAEDGGSPPGGYISDCDPEGPDNGWIIGSKHYARKMDEVEINQTRAMILADMVGDDNLTLRRELNSNRTLQDRVWSVAGDQGYNDTFINGTGGRVLDDHVPFLRRGIPSVDVIHLDRRGDNFFPSTWHRTNDTLEHVSADSLDVVGDTIERTLYSLDRELGRTG